MQVQRRRAITRTGALLIVLTVCAVLVGDTGAHADVDADADTPCADLLVTHRPDGSAGRTDAVQITAQQVERGHDGWASVGWRTAPGTQLRAVEVVHDGAQRTLSGDATTTEGPVSELRFCGTADGPLAAGDDVAAAADAGGTTATSERGGRWLGLALIGAGIGAAVGGVVLRLSRGARTSDSEGIG